MFKLKFHMALIWQWGVRCFGVHHMRDQKVRSVRFLEEVVELAQSLGVSQDQCRAVVDTVFSRPVGDVYQELGGSFVTFLVLCECMSLDPMQALEAEIQRCLAKAPEHFTKRNQDKLDLGLTG